MDPAQEGTGTHFYALRCSSTAEPAAVRVELADGVQDDAVGGGHRGLRMSP